MIPLEGKGNWSENILALEILELKKDSQIKKMPKNGKAGNLILIREDRS